MLPDHRLRGGSAMVFPNLSRRELSSFEIKIKKCNFSGFSRIGTHRCVSMHENLDGLGVGVLKVEDAVGGRRDGPVLADDVLLHDEL